MYLEIMLFRVVWKILFRSETNAGIHDIKRNTFEIQSSYSKKDIDLNKEITKRLDKL